VIPEEVEDDIDNDWELEEEERENIINQYFSERNT